MIGPRPTTYLVPYRTITGSHTTRMVTLVVTFCTPTDFVLLSQCCRFGYCLFVAVSSVCLFFTAPHQTSRCLPFSTHTTCFHPYWYALMFHYTPTKSNKISISLTYSFTPHLSSDAILSVSTKGRIESRR